jgi:hypothetical protein
LSSKSSNLKEEKTIGFEESLNLRHVGLVVTDTNVLTHFEVRDLIELSILLNSHVTVVNKEESDLFLKSKLLNAVVSICQLFGRDSQSSALNVEMFSNINQPRTPSTSKIEDSVSVFHI